MFERLIAAVISLFLVAGCATSTAPGAVGVGRSQLMIVPSVAINAQAAEGFSKLSSAAAKEGKLNTDPVMTARVREIAGKLIPQVRVYRPEAVGWDWQVSVIDSEKVNAFCMPGGKIAVYSGLIKKLDLSDTELAAVMGHEIAHALREHAREKASQQTLTNAVAQGIASSNTRNAGSYAALAQVGSQLFIHLPYSREMESEADVMGLELMARAGYDPKLASNVWVKMQKLEGNRGTVEFLATHPSHENRIAALEGAVPKVDPLYSVAVASRTGTPQAPPMASLQNPPTVALSATKSGVIGLPSEASALTSAGGAAPRRSGQESWQIEQLGKKHSCNPSSRAWLTSSEPGVELYSYQCSAEETWSLRCEMGNCRILK